MRFVVWAGISLVALYALAVAALFVLQRSLLYPVPQAARTTPVAAGFPQAEEALVKTSDGEQVILWHVPPAAGRPVVIFLHGRARRAVIPRLWWLQRQPDRAGAAR
jgi:hypothetical protein